MDLERLKKSMTNIKPDEAKIKRIEDVRNAYKAVADSLYCNCSDSRELSIAITNLETSLMYAVKSIILEN